MGPPLPTQDQCTYKIKRHEVSAVPAHSRYSKSICSFSSPLSQQLYSPFPPKGIILPVQTKLYYSLFSHLLLEYLFLLFYKILLICYLFHEQSLLHSKYPKSLLACILSFYCTALFHFLGVFISHIAECSNITQSINVC